MEIMLKETKKTKLLEREKQITFAKRVLEEKLCSTLNLYKISSPAFFDASTGVQDYLCGVERPVSFQTKHDTRRFEMIHSLAKWKRKALARFAMPSGEGIVTDMRAFRPDEDDLGTGIHSIYVDQWDWELSMDARQRNIAFLKDVVQKLFDVLKETERVLLEEFGIVPWIGNELHFMHTEELRRRYPHLDPKDREHAVCREYGAVFLIGIGGRLDDGSIHDKRSPDYDDWSSKNSDGFSGLNGDILLWHPEFAQAFEISSMGIRVDAETLVRQCQLQDAEQRLELPWHKELLSGDFPQSIGGGIGQSRLLMYLLHLEHIGQVQYGAWPDIVLEDAKQKGIDLL